jgi:hypothetical protein
LRVANLITIGVLRSQDLARRTSCAEKVEIGFWALATQLNNRTNRRRHGRAGHPRGSAREMEKICRHLAAALDQIVTILALSTTRRSKPRDADSGKWAIN